MCTQVNHHQHYNACLSYMRYWKNEERIEILKVKISKFRNSLTNFTRLYCTMLLNVVPEVFQNSLQEKLTLTGITGVVEFYSELIHDSSKADEIISTVLSKTSIFKRRSLTPDNAVHSCTCSQFWTFVLTIRKLSYLSGNHKLSKFQRWRETHILWSSNLYMYSKLYMYSRSRIQYFKLKQISTCDPDKPFINL